MTPKKLTKPDQTQPTFSPGLHLLLDLGARVGGEQLEGVEEAEQRGRLRLRQQWGLFQRGLVLRLQQRRRRGPDAAGQRPHKEGHG